MDIAQWNPYVRFARQKDSTLLQGLLRAVDHRILYFHSGSGCIEASGEVFTIAPGALIYMPAGTAYRYSFRQDVPVYSGFNFDFFQYNTGHNTPIPPVFLKDFSEDRILEKSSLESGMIPARCIHLENAFSFEEAFLQIAVEFQKHSLYYDARCSALLKDVLIRLVRQETSRDRGVNSQKADQILSYIHSHYHLTLTNKSLAAKFGYHENYISTLILKHTGLTLHQYLLNHRMQMAVGLLQSTELSVTEVAERVGMPDIKHFSKSFKKFMGHPPSSFKIK